jgi:hypothetical protein
MRREKLLVVIFGGLVMVIRVMGRGDGIVELLVGVYFVVCIVCNISAKVGYSWTVVGG